MNHSEGLDEATAIKVDDGLEQQHNESKEDEEEDEISVQPSGSRTLDQRLNPDVPNFVPGVTNRLLAAKIVDELVRYIRWSDDSDEDISYGPHYDGIWSESCIQMQQQSHPRHRVPFIEPLHHSSLVETVGDQEQQLSLESEDASLPKGRCCACKIM